MNRLKPMWLKAITVCMLGIGSICAFGAVQLTLKTNKMNNEHSKCGCSADAEALGVAK